jgi:DNA-binding CsgD family transcriptional regulator
VALGRTDAEIAAALKISRTTAHQYVETARRQLDARTRAHLAAKAVTLGLATSGPNSG